MFIYIFAVNEYNTKLNKSESEKSALRKRDSIPNQLETWSIDSDLKR